jgi:hypothetical protein
MRRARAGRWLCLALLLGLGCQSMDAMGRRSALKETQLHYTQMLRWGEFERASQLVEPEVREEFQRYAPVLDGMRITEYDIGDIAYAEGSQSATVTVTYHAYSLATLVETRFREQQEWIREDGSNTWRVRPRIDGLLDVAAPDAR